MDKLPECAMSIASDLLLPQLKNVVNAIKDAPKDVAGMKSQLDRIQAMIHEVDRMAEAKEDSTVRDQIKAKTKHMIDTSFCMEDIMDKYAISEEKQHADDPGCVALPCKTLDFAKAMASRLQFSYMNEDVKSEFQGVSGYQNQSSLEQGWRSSGGNENATLRYLQEAPFYIKEADVVGFDVPKKKLIDWSVDEKRKELSIMCIVAQGGQGKTTLVKKVFDSKEVVKNFFCRVWITVSQSYTVEALLRDMLQKLCDETRQSPPQNVAKQSPPQDDAAEERRRLAEERRRLTDEVRKHLSNKRYVVVFDDVWNPDFWTEMMFALKDNENGSRIFITTRNKQVSMGCNMSSSCYQYDLQPLTPGMSLALFNSKVFGSAYGCPNNLKDVSIKIVEKCEGLPLAIVAIGGLLSRKDKDPLEWQRFSQNLNTELRKNPHLTAVTKILALSFYDLPYHLKPCFLYFGIFPEDYKVKCVRLIRQWIAEGFVQCDEMKTSEQVANEYLTELIHRSLVQVSSYTSDDRIKSCRVHDLVRDIILKKVIDLRFCHFGNEHENESKGGMIRRLTITSTPIPKKIAERIGSPKIRSLHFLFEKSPNPWCWWLTGPIKSRLLKVLDFERVPLNYVPLNCKNLLLLKYLSIRFTSIENLPRSIGMLHNLETLDVRDTEVHVIPGEVRRLKRLRHLLGRNRLPLEAGICMEDGIGFGDLESLETLHDVDIRNGEEELERLKHLRVLGLTRHRQGYESALCSSINKMSHLEKLSVVAVDYKDEFIDLKFHVSAPVLKKLHLKGKLSTFPIWITQLPNLIKLTLTHSRLTQDPLGLLKNLPNLLCLRILDDAYEGECLHFADGGFENLKQLVLRRFYNLNSILIDRGALPHLKKFTLDYIPKLMEVPFGVYNLPMLEAVHIIDMRNKFRESIDPNRGKLQWVIQHSFL